MLRYYLDPESGEPHIFRHRVTEEEVEAIMHQPVEDRSGTGGTRVALGYTPEGRLLRIVYVIDSADQSRFIITAYPPALRAAHALRRRLKKKGNK